MCGISGIYQTVGGVFQTEQLKSIGGHMNHRGPDNFGWEINNNLGMAHNRLSLLDLSDKANQPFKNENYILAFNGEIYNFQAIRKRLENDSGISFETTSDTEVLFYLLIKYGVENALKQIKGMFAFSFYNKMSGELSLVRDRLGIKPLYYINYQNNFYWSSEIKSIVKTLNIEPDPTKTILAINGHGERSKENTLFKGVYSVKPGSFLTVNRKGEIAHSEYYSAINDFDIDYYNQLDNQPSNQVVAKYEELFAASIENMLISDAPMGVFVSGGVDSSLIAAIAKWKYSNIKLLTADVVGKFSEYEATKRVANHLKLDLFDYKFHPEMILRDWAEATYFYESPIVVHTNAIPFAKVAQLAKEMGVKAVLTGEGADELFLGYPKLLTRRYDKIALFPNKFIRSLYKLVPGLSEYLFPNSNGNVINFTGNLLQNFEAQLNRLEGEEQFKFLNKAKREEHKFTISMLNEHLLSLLHRNDRMGMKSSIEARFPFLDEDIVKFAINLPSKYKIGRTRKFYNYKHPFMVDKWIVRKTAEKYLPPDISHKKKFGFGMVGHKFLNVNANFFKAGWLTSVFELNSKTIDFLIETQDPYYIAKLASVEIFGRIFGRNEDISSVTQRILENISLIA